MDENKNEKPPPDSTDLAGWKQAIAEERLGQIRLESIVAAIQDLGPSTDKTVLHVLARHLSNAMLHILRKFVGTNHRNRGDDIITRVHAQLWQAIVTPKSADGIGLRAAFITRLKNRTRDAIAAEAAAFRIPEEFKCKESVIAESDESQSNPESTSNIESGSSDDEPPSKGFHHSARWEGGREMAENIDVEAVLLLIPDDRKRLAFRLFMDDVPYKSTKSNSISEALGISEKTARHWIEEVQELLKSKIGEKL